MHVGGVATARTVEAKNELDIPHDDTYQLHCGLCSPTPAALITCDKLQSVGFVARR